jgi:putative ABC transport system permease protein
MRDDLKTAFRSLLSSRTFTAVALTVLALGIGASAAIFSVVDAVVLRGLPFDEHDRLVALGERRTVGRGGGGSSPEEISMSAPQNFLDWAARQQVFDSMAAIAGTTFTLRDPGVESEELLALRVSGTFFDVLRVSPVLGRGFGPQAERDGREQIAVISDGLWRRRFGADPQVVGRVLPLDAGRYEIVGVMPPGFQYPVGASQPTDVWVPYVVPPQQRIRNPNALSTYLQTIARLKPGVSLAQAQAQMDQIAASLEAENPEWNRGTTVGVLPLVDYLVDASTRSWMLMLLGAVGIVLLIACTNVASLLLARATERERDISVRAALGAGRWRLVRQLMTESLVLSTLGTMLAIVLARWGIDILRTSLPEGVPRVAAIALDVRVIAAAALMALVTGVIFGIVPALQLSKPNLSNALKESSRGSSGGRGRQRLRRALVAAEVALAVVLQAGASLFIASLLAVMRIDPGFDPDGVIVAEIAPRWAPGSRPPDAAAAFTELADRLAQVPGVAQASVIAGGIPLGGSTGTSRLTVPGGAPVADDGISLRRVTPDYHQAMRIPLRAGRYFTANERPGEPRVIVINESAARKYFPGENAVGRTVRMGSADLTVVGIVGDVHQTSLEMAPSAEAYLPLAQTRVGFAELVIRTTGNPTDVLPAVKATVRAVLPDIPLRDIRTMASILDQRLAQRRFNMLLLGLFGLLGLVIAAVGIYGMLAYVVAQRTREIGVRMALGATRGAITRMILGSAARLVALGLLVGGVAAYYLSTAAERFLFRVDANDPRALVVAMVLLGLVGLIASVLPARRAASVDPLEALRAE